MSSSVAIALAITAKTEMASRAINKFTNSTSEKLSELAKNSNGLMLKGVADMVIGKQILSPMKELVDKSVAFEASMAGVAKYAEGAELGTSKFVQLSQQALDLSAKLGTEAGEVADNMAALAAAGVPVDELALMAEKTSLLGKAFDITAGEAGEAYKMIQAATGMDYTGMDKLMDTQNALTNQFGTTKDAAAQLITFMKADGAAISSALKIDPKYMAAIGNTFRSIGVETGVAGTAMKAFQRTILSNKNVAAIFNKAGGGIEGTMAIFEKAMKSGNATKWFNDNKFGQYSSQLGQLVESMNNDKGLKAQLNLAGDVEGNKGSVAKEAAGVMATNEEAMKRLDAQAEALKISLGNALLPVFRDLMKESAPLIEKITEWVRANPGLVSGILKTVAGIGALKLGMGALKFVGGGIFSPLFKIGSTAAKIPGVISKVSKGAKTGFSVAAKAAKTGSKGLRNAFDFTRFYGEAYGRKAVSGVQKAARKAAKGGSAAFQATSAGLSKFGNIAKTGVTKGITGIGKAFSAVSKILMANPWILIITAIAVAVYFIIKHWDKIKEFFIKLWDKVKVIFDKTWKWVKNMFLNYTPGGLIIKHWDKIKTFFSGVWDKVKDIFSKTWKWVKNMFLNYTPGGLIIKHWDKIKEFFTGLWDKVKDIFSKTWEWVKDWALKFITIGANLVAKLWEGIKEKWGDFKSKLSSYFDELKDMLPDWVTTLFGGGKSSVKIAHEMSDRNTPDDRRPGGGPTPRPLAPAGGNRSVNAPFSMTVNLSGEATQKDADLFGREAEKQWKKHFDRMSYDNDRRKLN